jgi:prevent-host-death family protein
MKVISISEGRRQFSKVAAAAANGEPQIVTKNGQRIAAILSYKEYVRLKKERSISELSLIRLRDLDPIDL